MMLLLSKNAKSECVQRSVKLCRVNSACFVALVVTLWLSFQQLQHNKLLHGTALLLAIHLPQCPNSTLFPKNAAN